LLCRKQLLLDEEESHAAGSTLSYVLILFEKAIQNNSKTIGAACRSLSPISVRRLLDYQMVFRSYVSCGNGTWRQVSRLYERQRSHHKQSVEKAKKYNQEFEEILSNKKRGGGARFFKARREGSRGTRLEWWSRRNQNNEYVLFDWSTRIKYETGMDWIGKILNTTWKRRTHVPYSFTVILLATRYTGPQRSENAKNPSISAEKVGEKKTGYTFQWNDDSPMRDRTKVSERRSGRRLRLSVEATPYARVASDDKSTRHDWWCCSCWPLTIKWLAACGDLCGAFKAHLHSLIGGYGSFQDLVGKREESRASEWFSRAGSALASSDLDILGVSDYFHSHQWS